MRKSIVVLAIGLMAVGCTSEEEKLLERQKQAQLEQIEICKESVRTGQAFSPFCSVLAGPPAAAPAPQQPQYVEQQAAQTPVVVQQQSGSDSAVANAALAAGVGYLAGTMANNQQVAAPQPAVKEIHYLPAPNAQQPTAAPASTAPVAGMPPKQPSPMDMSKLKAPIPAAIPAANVPPKQPSTMDMGKLKTSVPATALVVPKKISAMDMGKLKASVPASKPTTAPKHK